MLEGRLGVAAGEFARFAVVGVVSNAALYLLYLLLTQLGLGHKLAASITYAIGVLQTFFFNRSWSFRDRGAAGPALGRYVGAYGLGYALNMLVLALLVDRMGYPHQWVQGVMIIVLAALLFAAQKLWVFREKGKR
jgi:putative flippase GtrA